jgi:hypothetical protein
MQKRELLNFLRRKGDMLMPALYEKSGHNSQGSLDSYFIKKSVVKINQKVSTFSEKRNFFEHRGEL